jgi:hypothetical protein
MPPTLNSIGVVSRLARGRSEAMALSISALPAAESCAYADNTIECDNGAIPIAKATTATVVKRADCRTALLILQIPVLLPTARYAAT